MDRVALLPVDNQSGDPSLDWVRDAVPAMVGEELTGVGNFVPLRESSSIEATSQGANHMVQGYVEKRKGGLHFEFAVEDTSNHRARTLAVDGDVVRAAAELSHLLDPGAVPFSTSQVAAVEAWAHGDYAKAVELDPNFGSAWNEWVQKLGQAAPPQALEVADRALAQKGLKSPLNRAELSVAAAKLRNDPTALAQAVDEVAKFRSKDVAFLDAVAVQEASARRFDRSVRYYAELVKLQPDNLGVYNLYAYSQFFAGDLERARKSLQLYAKGEGQAANALDSEGELLFMAGKFAEAEQLFLRAHEASPGMLQGADLLKASYAHWLKGDLPGADAVFEKYLSFLGQAGDPNTVWRRSIWEYSTGRIDSARARLRSAKGPVEALAQSQLQVWDNVGSLKQDLATLQRGYESTPATADGLVRTLYARELLKAGRPDEAGKLLTWWPLPESGEPLLQSVVYPYFLELRKQLGK